MNAKVEKYVHHGAEVSVISQMKGKHRDICLCFQGCRFFKPGEPNNCSIAQQIYEMCVEHNLVTPVLECAKYEAEE